jgi:hypothetical protein
LIDARRSVVVVDPLRPYVIVKDPTDLPVRYPGSVQEINVREKLEKEWKHLDSNELTETLREVLIHNPKLINNVLKLLGPQIDKDVLLGDKQRIEQIQSQWQTEAVKFVRLVELATNATISYGQLTMMESLGEAQRVIPDVIKRWKALREGNENEYKDSELAKPILDQKQLECRLYLLKAVYLTLLSGKSPKEHLTSLYGSHVSLSTDQIHQALETADKLDTEFTRKWLDSLAQWEFIAALTTLRRDLPSEDDLLDLEQMHVASIFDVFDLIKTARYFRDAIVRLNPDHEIRASAFLKLGQAVENAMITYAASTVVAVDDEVRHLLEILTGRELTLERGL